MTSDTEPQDDAESAGLEIEEAKIQVFLEKIPEEMLTRALADKISKEPEVEIQRVVRAAAVSQSYRGPIPPPAMLGQYDEVSPGFADRIVAMAENEQKHRHGLESLAVEGEINKDTRGQHYALSICLTVVFGSMFLIYNGHDVAGSALAGGSLMGLAYIFITGRKPDKEDEDS